LRAAYGVIGTIYPGDQEMLERPVPSGGGLYPLEVYLLVLQGEDVAAGVYHYAAQAHALEQLGSLALPGAFVGQLFLGQPYLARAAVVVVLTAVVERSLGKYQDRGYRYLLLEAGHVAQNLNLAAAALGLGSLNLGGFFDCDLGSLLGLDLEAEVPLYGIALGVPAGTDRAALREPAGQAERGR
jgi:SagB-type dehydrogenase family enzyme